MKVIATTILGFFTKHLLAIHKGETLLTKAKGTLSIALSVSPFVWAFERISDWTLANEAYVTFVLGAIAVDHVLGTCMRAFKPTWSTKKNILGLMTKLGLVVAMGFLFEGINEIISEDSFVKSYIIIVLRLVVFLYPAGSAFMNSATLTKGKFPPIGLINKVTRFNLNLDLKEFKGKQENPLDAPVNEYEEIPIEDE